MSNSTKLMDTEPGGEQTQYESINTFTKPHSKTGGQLSGGPETKVANSASDLEDKTERGERTAANMRYGQGISEQGVAPGEVEGVAKDDGVDAGRIEGEGKQMRREQGYHGSNEVGRDIGA